MTGSISAFSDALAAYNANPSGISLAGRVSASPVVTLIAVYRDLRALERELKTEELELLRAGAELIQAHDFFGLGEEAGELLATLPAPAA